MFLMVAFLVFFIFTLKNIDKLGAGLVGIHPQRSGMFNGDVMFQSWLAVGGIFLFLRLFFGYLGMW
tara:strand:+ start:1585 stop:1782 length:198 start_codon:yes stop_codon:yes gene_type:complete